MRIQLNRDRQRGISLIEVLVTLLILTFGLMGVAGLLVNGISNSSSSEHVAKANALAADMADRIRANPGASGAMSATNLYNFNYAAVAPTSPSTIVDQDKKQWLDALADQLPGGDGQVTGTITGGQRKFVIDVQWSNCLGTLSQAESDACASGTGPNLKKTISFELRL